MIAAGAVGAALVAEAIAWSLAGFVVSLAFSDGPGPIGWLSFLVVICAAFFVPGMVGARTENRRAHLAVVAFGVVLILGVTSLEVGGSLEALTFGWLVDFYREPESTLRAGAPAIAAVLLLAGAWATGAARASREGDLETHARSLALPFAMVIALALLSSGSARASEAAILVAAFFAAAVISLAWAQLALGGATLGAIREGGITAVLLGITTLVATLGFVVLGLGWRYFGDAVASVVGAAVEAVLVVILTPIAWILAFVVERLTGGGDPLAGLDRLTEFARTDVPAAGEDEPSVAERIGIFGLRTLALAAFAGLMAGIILLWTRVRKRYQGGSDAVSSLEAAGSLLGDIRSLLRGVLPGSRGTTLDPGASAAARLYLDVLHDAERKGHPRAPWQTPHEFAPVLHDTYATQVTDEITESFEEARYGGREPDFARLATLERRWRALRR